MKIIIHRGTKEIGGSCVELSTDTTRIIIDFGTPLVKHGGAEYNHKDNKYKSVQELITDNILPTVEGLYNNDSNSMDAVIISHPHQDHYGFINYISPSIPIYLGEACHQLINITILYTRQEHTIQNPRYFKNKEVLEIGDIKITPFLFDHSGFDSYGFLIENDGKRLFYSGDFRSHGRKSWTYNNIIKNPPPDIDYLLMEGTNISYGDRKNKTEQMIEEEILKVLNKDKFTLATVSGQNIDRLVSIFRAVKRTNRTLVCDIYTAAVLEIINQYSKNIPTVDFGNIRVLFSKDKSHFYANILAKNNLEKILYKLARYKIKLPEIANDPNQFIMLVRPGFENDILKKLKNIEGGNYIYSMWEGYLKKKEFLDLTTYLKKRQYDIHKIHTSGHADLETLKTFVEHVNPKLLIPIHTFEPELYQKYFKTPIKLLKDGETFFC